MPVLHRSRSLGRTWSHPEGAANVALGGYRLLSEIAVGELCSISLARSLQGPAGAGVVAVKRLRNASQHSNGRSRLLREARVLLGLRSPNLVRVLEIHTQPELFVVMEHVPGASLRFLLTRAREVDALRYIVPIFVDALRGLAVLHNWKDEEGAPGFLVHQAPTARHMLVGLDGVARLIDLSHVHGRQLGCATEGAFWGERDQAAPEQLAGRAALDPRCDIFIVGTALLEALACARDAQNATLSDSHVRAQLGSLQAVGQRARSNEKSDRFWSADEMAYALQKAADDADLYADRAAVGAYVRRVLALPHAVPAPLPHATPVRHAAPLQGQRASLVTAAYTPRPARVEPLSVLDALPPRRHAASVVLSAPPAPHPGRATVSHAAPPARPRAEPATRAPSTPPPVPSSIPGRRPRPCVPPPPPPTAAVKADGLLPRTPSAAAERAHEPVTHAVAPTPSIGSTRGSPSLAEAVPSEPRASASVLTDLGLPTTTRPRVGIAVASAGVIFILLLAALRSPQLVSSSAATSLGSRAEAPPASIAAEPPAVPLVPLAEPPLHPIVTSIVAVPAAPPPPPPASRAAVVISTSVPRTAPPVIRAAGPVTPRVRPTERSAASREPPVGDPFEDGLRSLSHSLPPNPYE